MDKLVENKVSKQDLYPPIDPFDQRTLRVDGGHQLYVEQCGDPQGIPVIVLHGGPGGGCSPTMRRYFNPEHYRIILFDQRGCGRSRPLASVNENTTWHLIADIEKIRRALDIPQWFAFGGSWGATLALIYAQQYPETVTHLILRGVFLMTKGELDWFYGGGAGKIWPEHWERFVEPIPRDERHDLITAYHRRLFSGNLTEESRYARTWMNWENSLASAHASPMMNSSPSNRTRAFARLENHYFMNNGFLREDGQILNEMSKIEHIPGIIIQGRLDMICPPDSAYKLAKLWRRADLKIFPNSGHALSEPAISTSLVSYMDKLAPQGRSLIVS
ncbi:MAG: prolyl aminopeptidase [Aestuariivita sp.]|nr:prolyl aminopeptidase [Aestuariivita sp.]MCY4345862.1 prolyl aminopeptidase [Aestuariivita sp.]